MYKLLILSIVFLSFSCDKNNIEVKLSKNNSKNYDLDGRHNFSPDDKWLVYDTRPIDGGIDDCKTIEKINIETGEVKILYNTNIPKRYGPGVGAASYSPIENKVIFIHGLKNNSEERPYEQWRRTGVIVDEGNIEQPIYMDARDVTFPFTPGVLRGGTHDHEWSGDGKWIGFTYNDAIMKELEDKTGEHWNLRTIGVSKPIGELKVDHSGEDENVDGKWFSVLVVKVVPNPKAGSDEVSYAAGDSWIGSKGYKKENGTLQRARAFLGRVSNKEGKDVDEVFVVDIPEDITKANRNKPLEGTKSTFPNPPKGALQRRLTFTANSKYPGCIGALRCSPDGKFIGYRTKDKKGIMQVFFTSPKNGNTIQVTHHNSDVQSAIRWDSNNDFIYYIWDNSVIQCSVKEGNRFGTIKRITVSTSEAPTNIALSHDGRTIVFNRMSNSSEGKRMLKQIYKIIVE